MVVRSEVEEEIEVREVGMILEVREDLDFYHWVYMYLHFIKDDCVYKREDMVGVESDPYEEDIEDMVLNCDRERHCLMVFKDNTEGWMGRRPF